MARLDLMEQALKNAQAAGRTDDTQALQQAIVQAKSEMRPALSQAYYNAQLNGNADDAQAMVTYLQQHGMTLAPPGAQQQEALFQKQQARDVASMNPLQRFGLGYGHTANAIVQGIKQNTIDRASDALDVGGRSNRVQQDMQNVAEDRNLSQALNNTIAGKLGNLTGGTVTTAPVAAIPGLGEAGIGTRVLASGAQGAGLGYLQPYATSGEHVANTTLGGLAGAAIPAVTGTGSKLLTGIATPEARRLIAQGVKPSVGQMLGGAIGRTEQAQMSLPLTGDIIQAARNQGIDTFNRAATNKVLAPIGAAVPEGPTLVQRLFGTNQSALPQRVATGQPSMAYAAGAASNAFEKALGGTRGVFDSQLGNELASIINNAPAGARGELADAIQNGVLNKFAASNGTLSGQAFNDLRSDLGKAAVKYRQSESAANRDVGTNLGDVLDSLDSMFARNNGQQAMDDLAAARQAYRGTMELKDATNAAGRTREGVFTPGEFLGAVKKNDASKGKAAFSRGRAYLQDFGNDAQSALGNTIGNSFTFDRIAHGTLGGWAAAPLGAPLAVANLPGMRGTVQSLLAPQAAPVLRSRLAGLLGQYGQQGLMPLSNALLLQRGTAVPPAATPPPYNRMAGAPQ